MIKAIKKHLEVNQITFINHFMFAIKAGVLLLYAGVASIIHAICPALFDGVPSRIVANLYHGRIKNHPNPEYRKL